MKSILTLAFVGLATSGALAQKSSNIHTDCLLMVLDQVELAARRDGILEKTAVRMGDDIQHGELAFQLSRREANANLNVAEAKHLQSTAKASGRATIDAAEVELQRSTKEVALLEEVGRVPYLEKFRAINTNSKNKAELAIAKMTHDEDVHAAGITEAELQLAQIDVEDRRVLSPISGTVVKQMKFLGDWCSQGDPVLKILRMDRLMLQGIVNIKDIAPNRIIGMHASATFQLADQEPIVMNGLKITKASPEVDLDGNYLVWTFVSNRKETSSDGAMHWLLRPGISGALTIGASASTQPRREMLQR